MKYKWNLSNMWILHILLCFLPKFQKNDVHLSKGSSGARELVKNRVESELRRRIINP
jgi:hypothetical protein